MIGKLCYFPNNVFLGFESAVCDPFEFRLIFSAFCQREYYILVCLVVWSLKSISESFVLAGNIAWVLIAEITPCKVHRIIKIKNSSNVPSDDQSF